MIKARESKMLDKVRRWRKKAYDVDKAKPPAVHLNSSNRRPTSTMSAHEIQK